MKLLPPVGVVLKVIGLPFAYACAQAEPQMIAPSLLVTVPEPLPARVTVSVLTTPFGVTLVEAAEAEPVPTAFVAVTVKV